MATPKNKALYSRVKSEAKKKFKTWPSAIWKCVVGKDL